MTVGLGKIGDAMVMNNPDAGNLYNPANVSPTVAYAGLVILVYTFMIYGLVFVNSKYRARRRAQSELTNAHLHIQRSGLYQSRYEEYQPDRICGRSVNLQQ